MPDCDKSGGKLDGSQLFLKQEKLIVAVSGVTPMLQLEKSFLYFPQKNDILKTSNNYLPSHLNTEEYQ